MIADIEGDFGKLMEGEMPSEVPILPVRNIVLFPGVVVPIIISRESSMKLVRKAEKQDSLIGIVCQKDPDVEVPVEGDLYNTGVFAKVVKQLTLPNGMVTVIVQGMGRLRLFGISKEMPYLMGHVEASPELLPDKHDKEWRTAIDDLRCIGNTFQVGYSRTFHPCFRYGGGIDFLYSGENHAMYEANGALDRFTTADYFALAPFASFDLLYGDLVLHLSFAYYVWQPADYLPKGYQKFYERLALHYHFGPQKQFFVGAGMKVHLDCIDYIEWTVGMNLFSWKGNKQTYSP